MEGQPTTDRPTGIVAFLFTDLEESTLRWEADPDVMRADVARHAGLIDAAIERHGGVPALEQGAGDSTVTAFSRASDALAAAVDLQLAMHDETWAGDRPLLARVVVHAGEAQLDGSAYSGPTMNRCGRLLQAAHGGQILASSTAIDLAAGWLPEGAVLADLGRHRFRGIDRPIGVVQVSVPPLPSAFPPLRTVDGGGATVPVPDSSFVGREDDLEVVGGLIDAHRAVTLVGAGGCGKTRLAIELAHLRLGRFPHGIVWIDLAPVASADAVLDTAATALGVRGVAPPTLPRITAELDQRAALVVIDNCEHVLDTAAALVAAIEAGCPSARVLATSREPLGLRDEAVWRVPSLALPAEDGSDVLDVDAGRLLVDRIRRVRPGYEPDADDARALAEICRRLDGIPLALELAAARTATIAPTPLARRLAERFSMLAGGGRDVLARQRTLEASVAWSYQLLDDRERDAFRRLSVFPGSFPLDAAVAILGGDDRATTEQLLFRLIDCSLLVDRTAGDQPRASMLETVRWYARERLAEADQADAAFGRHLDWAVDLALTVGSELEARSVREALEVLEAHVDDLRSAMAWAIDHDRALDAASIITATSSFWGWRGRLAEAMQWLDRSKADGPAPGPAQALEIGITHSQLSAGLAPSPASHGEPTLPLLELARELGDRRSEGRILIGRSLAFAFGKPGRAELEAEAGRELCRADGDRFWEGIALYSIAMARITTGRFDDAEAALDELRPLARSLGHPQLIADEIARRVLVDRRFGRYDAVKAAAAEIDAVTEGLTDLNSRALVHAGAAFVDVAQGRAAEALAAMEDLYHRYETAGELSYLPSFALPMMEALIDLGRPTEAIARCDLLWDVCGKIVSWRLTMGPVRGAAHLCAGDADAARDALADVIEAADETGNDYAAAIAMRTLAVIDRREGAYSSAEQRLHEALGTHAAHGCPQQVADVLEELAGLELDHERPLAAATLFGAASSIRAQGGVVRRVGRQDAYEADLATLGDTPDADEVAVAREQGARLGMQDAVDLAQRGRGERGRPSTGWESLTATEAKVAELVARGRTNPQIAEQLIMGRATVKTHVSNILRKLDLENRTQLAHHHARREQA
jgi:predicted ATPase/class 3 adenylate cyclase/DNA-binding CsgD family transcriptional regulator